MHGLPEPSPEEIQHELDRVVDELARRFGAVDRATVARLVADTYAAIARDATIRAHLIPLTEHSARERLAAHVAGIDHVRS
ncbi:MAG TPA: hypothetical protein VM677_24770 [Actinokineospora sp.]|jgi:ArsR family transcriptional regulator|nr:hypothetical protein [Actinokineospora sp.]